MLDFRWYLATLTAILVALAAGILVGSAALGQDTWAMQESRLVADIEGRLRDLRDEEAQRQRDLAALQQQLAAARSFEDAATAWLVHDRLGGVRLSVVAAEAGDVLAGVEEALRAAGAELAWTVDVPARWTADPKLDGVLGRNATPEAVAARLGEALAAGDRLTLKALADAGAIRVEPASPTSTPDAQEGAADPSRAVVVLVGRGKSPDIRPLVAMVRAAAREGARVVVATPSDSAFDIAAVTGPGVAVVDDLDRPAGLAALVFGAAGFDGHFGFKPGGVPLPPAPGAGGS